MPEIGTATVKVVPDTSEFSDELIAQMSGTSTSGFNLLMQVAALLLLVCSPAFVWAVYGWAF